MAGFSTATLERIRAASDIVDIIGAYLPLKKAGANFTALCPFHKEKTPSFNVNPHRQIFHCFGCHKGGDVFSFVKEFENIGFVDAVRRLAERAKIPLEFDSHPGEQQSRHLKDQLLQIHDQIATRWQNCLANEAAGQLAEQGGAVDLLRVRALPFCDDVMDFIARHDSVFVVEQNRDGQLRMLLINEGDIDQRKLRRVLHYDGTPITASIITGAIVEVAQELKIVPMRQPVPAAE